MTRVVVLSSLLALSAFAGEKPRVAVLYFEIGSNDPNLDVLKKGLAEMLISDLAANDALVLVERARLEEVLAELNLQQTRQFDPATAAKIGKLVGARYQVTGRLQVNPLKTTEAVLTAHVVDVETGKLVTINPPIKLPVKDGEIFEAEAQLGERLHGELAKLVDVTPPQPKKKQGKLSMQNAVKYSQALDAIDKKDKKAAKEKLEAVVKAQPDFMLATLELDRLMK